MFQVAAHPTHFNSPHARPHHQQQPIFQQRPAASAPAPAVQLPRTLQRPQFTEVSREALIAVSPELADVPREYVLRGLRVQQPQMLAGITSVGGAFPQTLQKSQLPPVLNARTRAPNSPQCAHPTHILALHSSKNPADLTCSLFPVHSLVLAASCAKIPCLPPSNQTGGSSVSLPVLPLSIPSPAAFSLLHNYLYTHSLPSLFQALMPFPQPFLHALSSGSSTTAVLKETLASGSALHQLSVYLFNHSKGNLATLTQHAGHIKSLWQNVVALGVYEPELWDGMDLAWEVILGAMNLAAAN